MRKREKAVLFWMTPKEYEHLKKQASLSGMTISGLLRAAIRGQEIRPRPPENLAALLRQMSAMGNNINQIAKVANSSKFIRSEDIEAIQKMQDELWKAIKEL